MTRQLTLSQGPPQMAPSMPLGLAAAVHLARSGQPPAGVLLQDMSRVVSSLGVALSAAQNAASFAAAMVLSYSSRKS